MPPIQTATNDKGDTVALVDNQWVPVKATATDAKGNNAYLVGANWMLDQPDETAPAKPKLTAGRVAGLTTTGISPYATAAGIGTALGGRPGAMIGTGVLGATDILTGGYNFLANYAGLPRVSTGSEAIRSAYNKLGVGTAPATPNEQMYVNAVEAATGAGLQAGAARTAASLLPRGTTARNVARELSRQPGAQVAGGVGASATVDYAREHGIDNPVLLAAAGLVGGVTAGGVASKVSGAFRPNTAINDVRNAAKARYAEVDASGVSFDPTSYDNFIDTVQRNLASVGYTPNAHIPIATWVNRLEAMRGRGASFSELDAFRSQMQKQLGSSPDANTRSLASQFTDEIDDYVSNAGPQDIFAGNLPQAQQAIGDARRLWTAVSKGEKIEELFRRASVSPASKAEAIRNEFRSLALNQKKMRQFSPTEREFIEQIARGRPLAKALEFLGDKSMQTGGYVAMGSPAVLAAGGSNFMPGFDPTTGLAIGTGMVAGGAGMKGIANAMTESQARNMQRYALGQRRPPGLSRNALMSPAAQNALAGATIDPELAAMLGYPGAQD
jgi:hypothetical protein